jgi:polysaccharide biosynthesis transport protein
MSRNFELLRQAGWRQELFDGLSGEPVVEPPSTDEVKRSIPRNERRRNDQIETLVRRVFFDAKNSRARTVMFTTVARGCGCTWTCAQTARALAGTVTGNVCVVDANFVSPTLHQHFATEAEAGLTDAVLGSRCASELAGRVDEGNLWLLTAGGQRKRASSLPDRGSLESHLRELRDAFDYVLIDGPPLASGSQALSIGRAGDGVVLVLKSTGIATDLLLKAKRQLETARVPLFGVVLNDWGPEPQAFLERLMK